MAYMQFGYIYAKKEVADSSAASFLLSRVELEGIEPSSAQGNHMLSTCLFQP